MPDYIDAAEVVGRQHGTAFFFSGKSASSFLDHIEQRYGQVAFETYLKGFMQGMDGNFKAQYSYLE